ncbi:MAG: TetR/AcrR family transcriptional regulator [Polyangiaceae bacterium]
MDAKPSEPELPAFFARLRERYPEADGLLGDDTRSRILAGTAIAIARHGLRESSVEHILEASRFSRRTFYKVFRSKESAVEALFATCAELLVIAVRTSVESAKTPAEKVIAAVDCYLELLELGGPLLIGLQAEAIRPDSPLAVHREFVFQALVGLLDLHVRQSLGMAVDPYVFRCLLMGMEGLIIEAERRAEFTVRERERVRAAFLPVLLRTLAPEGAKLARLPKAPE